MRKMQQKEKVECDCFIFIFYSNNKIYRMSDIWTLNNEVMYSNPFGTPTYTPSKVTDFLDKRKSYGFLFNFCPRCGVKIDWKTIKEELCQYTKVIQIQ